MTINRPSTLRHGCHAVILLLLVGWLTATPVAQAAGAWADTQVAPVLRQRGWRYATEPMKPAADMPLAGDHITRVAWRYHYRTWYRGFQAMLCARDICVDATTERDWTQAFSGLPVTTRFRFYFLVAGQGMLAEPMRGGRLRLIVNFQ